MTSNPAVLISFAPWLHVVGVVSGRVPVERRRKTRSVVGVVSRKRRAAVPLRHSLSLCDVSESRRTISRASRDVIRSEIYVARPVRGREGRRRNDTLPRRAGRRPAGPGRAGPGECDGSAPAGRQSRISWRAAAIGDRRTFFFVE